MGESEKTPTIEQKSTFASRTKSGSDVEFVATIKFFINPSGDVRICAPGGSDSQIGAHEGFDSQIGAHEGSDNSQIGAGSHPSDDTGPAGIPKEFSTTESTKKNPTEESNDKNKEITGEKDKVTPKNWLQPNLERDKFPHHKEVDKQIPRIQSDCAISQFIPDPCKAIDDLTKTIKGFFSGPSPPCPPCPRDVNGSATTPQPKPMITGELGETGHPPASEIIDKEKKYDM